ncbi:LacI family DNA-binding transcriptional regulator [Nakamurella flavida]|uniref:LacI family DNA-binding transcriptional regulator n=1 Tax=Nakamurella flavida TaxID=363630 RepID=A0A938YNB4_9ACTN|nr:LacI family DNA-binding transcriptional regulator [Nakamurella flavida]MBM9475906.1 LacI family DNA-binding transcriptional regulator [Nakamurella flavida]MBM9478434.1 LacI family DNA-binding transcriptional regulator [Nakamurella flavida]MDP9777808.1 LacI family transcriptional regulator [Nakamurella flavida]
MADQVTLRDVAQLAGVSVATASRALSGAVGRTVRADLRARVLDAAGMLNYSPNAAAQAMVRGSTSTVALVVHDIADPYAAAVAAGVMATAARRGLMVTVAATGSDPEVEVRHVEMLRRQRARAVILGGSRTADPFVQQRLDLELSGILADGGSVASIGQDTLPVHTVRIDNAGGARSLATSLVGLGYRRFAVLTGPESWLTSEDRLTGFQAGVEAAGAALAPESVMSTQFSRDGGYVAMAEMLDRDPGAIADVDAVFAVSDVMAVGAMAALRDRGHHIPGDVAVAGFDDIGMLRDVRPALTTVRLPLERIGSRALELALDLRPAEAEDRATPVVETVTGEVVVRASTPGRN